MKRYLKKHKQIRPHVESVSFVETVFGRHAMPALGFVWMLSILPPCGGEESPPLIVHRLLAKAGENPLYDLHTIEYKCRIETLDAKGKSINKETLHYVESSRGYRWEHTIDPGASKSFERSIVAWDGERSMTFDSVAGMIYTTTAAPKVAAPPAFVPRGPLEVFAFLRNQESEQTMQAVWPELQGFSSPGVWQSFAKRVTNQNEVTAAGEKGIIVEAPGGPFRGFVSGPTLFRVKFSDEDALYPVSWERQWLQQDTVLAYTIQKFGEVQIGKEGSTWRFPAEARIESRDPNAAQPPRFTKLISTDEVRINHTVEEDAFTIDPAIATNIYDLDAKTIITVPK
jgi:hypothetical protein